MASGRRLDHWLGRVRKSERAHVAGRVCAQVADRIDDLRAKNRRRQPAVERAGFAVLPNHQSIDRLAQLALRELHRAHVINAQHLPLGRAGRRADCRRRCDPGIVRHFVHAHQLWCSGIHGRCAEHASMIGKAATARCKNGAALERRLDVTRRENLFHVPHSCGPPGGSREMSRTGCYPPLPRRPGPRMRLTRR